MFRHVSAGQKLYFREMTKTVTMIPFQTACLLLIALLGLANAAKRVCYYSNWSQYRPGSGRFMPSDIPPNLCTHLIYSFAKVNSSYELDKFEWNDFTLYQTFNDLKKKNPDLKTLLATGGWNAGSVIYSQLVSNKARREKFAKQAIQFVREKGFDGFDLDWEYPARRGGAATDKENFIQLIKDLNHEIDLDAAANPDKSRLLLTAAVAAGKDNIDPAYDIPSMGEHLDFINLMSYDLHGAWENVTGHNSPLYGRSGESGGQEQLNVDWAAKYWVSKGCPREKLIIGLATYGRHFQLSNTRSTGFGAPVRGPGTQGTKTRENGFLAYYEVCEMLANGGQRKWNNEHKVPYLVSGDQWVGYDDEESFRIKLNYIKDNGYGGAMVWNIDLDDFNKQCSLTKERYPLMRLMGEILDSNTPATTARPRTTSTSGTTKEQTDATSGVTDATSRVTGATSGATDATSGVTNEVTNVFTCTGKSNGFYRDPVDCTKYYQCWSGNQYHSNCPSGLRWNQGRQYCDYPENVKCSVVITTETITTKTDTTPETTTSTTERPTTSTTSTTEQVTSTTSTTERTTSATSTTEQTLQPSRPTDDPDDFCVGKSNGLHKNLADCGSYFSCWEGQTFLYECSSGTLFNAETKNCDWKYNVDCDEEGDKTEFCSDKVDGLYSYPNDCSKYYNCGSKMTYVLSCSAGTYWNPDIGNCDWIANVDCEDRPVPPVASNLGNVCSSWKTELLPDPSNCHNFIRCVNGVPYPNSCGNYLKFNPKAGACDWPDNVDCVNPARRAQGR